MTRPTPSQRRRIERALARANQEPPVTRPHPLHRPAMLVGALVCAALAVLFLVLLISSVARADDGVPTADPLVGLLTAGAMASAIIIGVLLFARGILPTVFAPKVSTEHSKGLNLVLALVCGLVLGALGVAPALAVGLTGKLLGGFLCSASAVFGRDFVTRGSRILRKPTGSKEDDDADGPPSPPAPSPA